MHMRMGLILGMALMTVACSADAAKTPYIKMKSGDTLEVRNVNVTDAEGNLTFDTADGSFILSRRLYDYAVIAYPEDIKAAEKLLQGNEPEKALAVFGELEKKYRFLGWKNCCLYNRMQALLKLNRIDEVLHLGEGLNAADNNSPLQEKQYLWRCQLVVADIYLKQLKNDKAVALLQQLNSCDDSEIAADSYNRQADLLLSQNRRDEAMLLYMRPVIMFDRDVALRAYSLRQIVKLMQEQNDKRGEKFAAMLSKEYPEVKTAAKKTEKQ